MEWIRNKSSKSELQNEVNFGEPNNFVPSNKAQMASVAQNVEDEINHGNRTM